MGGASKNRKIRDRVDSEGKYGRWKLQIIGSCYKSSRPRVGSPTDHFVYRFVSFKSLLAYRLVRLQVISSTSHTSSLIRVGSPKSQLSFTSVSPKSRFAYGSICPLVLPPPPPGFFAHSSSHLLISFTYKSSRRRVGSPTSHSTYGSVSPTNYLPDGSARAEINLPTMSVSLQAIPSTGRFFTHFRAYTERLLRERELSTKIYLGTEVKFCQVCNKH